jgi:hypothetical protein
MNMDYLKRHAGLADSSDIEKLDQKSGASCCSPRTFAAPSGRGGSPRMPSCDSAQAPRQRRFSSFGRPELLRALHRDRSARRRWNPLPRSAKVFQRSLFSPPIFTLLAARCCCPCPGTPESRASCARKSLKLPGSCVGEGAHRAAIALPVAHEAAKSCTRQKSLVCKSGEIEERAHWVMGLGCDCLPGPDFS